MLGDSAMHQMAKSNVFLSGLGGVGVEIGEFRIVWVTIPSSVAVSREAAIPWQMYDQACMQLKGGVSKSG